MFVLQECTICFEDFGPERYPYSIPCGHVFCNPCLESLLDVLSTAGCPNCRTPYTSDSIRKLICPLQDPAPNVHSDELEAETLMWGAIHSAAESPRDHEQRKSLIEHNPPESMMAAGMSARTMATVSVMSLLVEVEERNRSLEDELNMAQATKQSLYDSVSALETQIHDADDHSNLGISRDLKLMMANMQKIQCSIEVIDKNTMGVARHYIFGIPRLSCFFPGTQAIQTGERSPQTWRVASYARRTWLLFDMLAPILLPWLPLFGRKLQVLFLYMFLKLAFWVWDER